MRTVKTRCITNNLWLTSYNLWICDNEHIDTCHYILTLTKPTQRQIRKFKKESKHWFRFGTRSEQRNNQYMLTKGLPL